MVLSGVSFRWFYSDVYIWWLFGGFYSRGFIPVVISWWFYPAAQNMPEGSLVMSDGWVQVDAHVNVADGGLAELTLTYLRPSDRRHRGDYRCVAQNQHGRAHVDFSVDVER